MRRGEIREETKCSPSQLKLMVFTVDSKPMLSSELAHLDPAGLPHCLPQCRSGGTFADKISMISRVGALNRMRDQQTTCVMPC